MTPDSVCTFNSPLTAPTAGAAKFSSSKGRAPGPDRKSTRLNSSHLEISYAVFCLKKKKKKKKQLIHERTLFYYILEQHDYTHLPDQCLVSLSSSPVIPVIPSKHSGLSL